MAFLKRMAPFFNDDTPPGAAVVYPDPSDPNAGDDPQDPAGDPADNNPAPPAGEFDTLRINDQDVKIPVSQREEYLRRGYEFDTVNNQLQSRDQQLQMLAQFSGFDSVDDFVQAVQAQQEEERIRTEAQKLGLDESLYRQHMQPVNEKLSRVEQELQQVRQQRALEQIDAQVNQLRAANPDFDKYQDKVFELAMTRGYNLEDAYKLASYEDKMASLRQETEQEVLARVTGRSDRQVLPSADKPSGQLFDPANMSGADLRNLAERARRGEKIAF